MHHVLLLNMGYEPLNIISWRRALSLILRDRVDPACAEGMTVQSASTILHIPNVIRLRRYVHVPVPGKRWSRRAVLRRDRYTCIYCGTRPGDRRSGPVTPRRDITIDHILPVCRGGKSTWDNTACACRSCNQYKGSRTPEEAGLRLLWHPEAPRITFWELSGEIPTAWEIYLETGG
jgi:5-methylcytosine-specific restriction endonuclease McrA